MFRPLVDRQFGGLRRIDGRLQGKRARQPRLALVPARSTCGRKQAS